MYLSSLFIQKPLLGVQLLILHFISFWELLLPFLRAEIPHIRDFQSWAWWYTPVIPALGRLRQEACELKVSLGYIAS
jgi:hypothetical protein